MSQLGEAKPIVRDAELVEMETKFRIAIRDAVNEESRKPFHWGGLSGYSQMEAIGQVLPQIMEVNGNNTYWRRLNLQVKRVLEKNRTLATDLQAAHQWLKRIAACLHYPPSSQPQEKTLSSQQVAQDMQKLIAEFRADARQYPAQARLHNALRRTWNDYGTDLLPCYDTPGLPPDNLKLESFFQSLRCRQRRISGRKSTPELRIFGQYQVLCTAETEAVLLEQIRNVPLETYQLHRQRLAKAESQRQFLHRLHRDASKTMQALAARYIARLATLQVSAQPTATLDTERDVLT